MNENSILRIEWVIHTAEDVFMRFQYRKLGRLLILLGILLLAALVLPSELWPFCIGILLIFCGISIYRR